MNEKNIIRCSWPKDNPQMVEYHDTEWGVPLHEDKKLFEFLVLDAAQAGLSWQTILKKRENYRQAFDGFDAKKIADYTSEDFDRLMKNVGIVRNLLKIQSAMINAQKFLEVQKEFGTFDVYIWQFVGNTPIIHAFKTMSDIPTKTKESDAMSEDMKKRGFKFVGSTICYAFMQAAGLTNDHTVDCFRYEQLV